ncbi:hypothetical protein ASD97_26020 [Streptomyces sp. Root63]|uniref:hypothetical protein n=1 Tax=unclassified Streptomyces TaxID=2593676 RepID=UPI0006F68F06|nr:MULTISPECIES: hypothetical protein [unclassified Streptomyces]KQX43531.1 hypothetical protein ASD29_32325 [Streptomyces sp. Root1295]KRA34094.1 hypothetical protein ASD97_26020 [Streptomyces sp. Root63]
MSEFDESLLEYFPEDFLEKINRPSKASERSGWKNEVQAELDELGDLYDLPESLRDVDLPGVRL